MRGDGELHAAHENHRDHDELHRPQRRELVGDRRDSADRYSLDDRELVSQADRCGADAGARRLVERPSAEIVDAGATLDGENALEDALDAHLARIEHGRPTLAPDPNGHGEGEGALPAPDVAAEHDEVSATQSAAEELVESRESARDGLDRRRAVGYRVDAAEE